VRGAIADMPNHVIGAVGEEQLAPRVDYAAGWSARITNQCFNRI
jgi:hypothetical protein